MKKATAEWLKSARMDLENVAEIVHLEHLTPVAAFHAQQCIAKCLKAVLEEHSKIVPKDHSTLRLYGLAKQMTAVDVDVGLLTDLDNLYIAFWYPAEPGLRPIGKPTLADAKEFFEVTRNFYAQIDQQLAGANDAYP